jgi:diacylglycerol kinase (ATP)
MRQLVERVARVDAVNVLLIANPFAGEGSPTPGEVAACCSEAGADVQVELTAGAGDAIARAARAGSGPLAPDVVVAVGGDGTVAEVAEGLVRGSGRWPGNSDGVARAPCALLTVPAGSGNSAHRAIWGVRPWSQVVSSALDPAAHRVRHLDLIRLVELDRAAVLGANVGLVASVASCIEREKDAGRGQRSHGADGSDEERYWGAMARALTGFRPAPLRATLDGSVLHEGGAMLVSVGGVRRFGRGAFALLPCSVLDDGLLDVCVAAEVSRKRLGELAALVPAGAHLGEREVTYGRGRVVRVERLDGEGLEIEHDGDALEMGASLTLEVLAGAIPVLAPVGRVSAGEEWLWSS